MYAHAPVLYIGRLGDGAHAEDGIYVLLKEVIDNSIDEFKMQAGRKSRLPLKKTSVSAYVTTDEASRRENSSKPSAC